MMRVTTLLHKIGDFPIHPAVFALFPVVSLYVRNMGKGYLGEAAAIAAAVLASSIFLWLLVYLLVRDKRRSALVVSAFLVLFFSHGHMISLFTALLERMHLLDRVYFLVRGRAADLAWLAIWAALFALACFVSLRRLRDLRAATQFLNVIAAVLVVTAGVSFVRAGGVNSLVVPRLGELVTRSRHSAGAKGAFTTFLPLVFGSPQQGTGGTDAETVVRDYGDSWLDSTLTPLQPAGSAPDIYYIVLDMYARTDYLAQVFEYDNSEFLSFLSDKGFYVAHESTANYPYTTHSLASSLNSMYINEIAAQQKTIQGHGLSAAMIINNRLFGQLRQLGYRIVTFSSGYWFTEIKGADLYLEPPALPRLASEFQRGIVAITPLSVIPGIRDTQDDIDRGRVLYTFGHIADAIGMAEPTFVFAHINSPHPPFVFGADGEEVQSQQGYTFGEYAEAYRNQVAYVTERTRQVIEEILSRSVEPPIIIVQSDHGACYGPYDLHLAERMSILNAYYFPDQDYGSLYESITPVNSFRVVLNHYFGQDYELLEDRNYYSSEELPYDFVDVTDKVAPRE